MEIRFLEIAQLELDEALGILFMGFRLYKQ